MPDTPTAVGVTRIAFRTLSEQPAATSIRVTRQSVRVLSNVETRLAAIDVTRIALRTLSPPFAAVILTTVPYATVTTPLRRMRETNSLTSEEAWLYVWALQVDAETGVGTASGDGEDPVVLLQWSRDHGHTWAAGRTVSLGRAGEFLERLMWRRLGRARNWRFRLTCDAEVPLTILGAHLNPEKGSPS
jgi:hypothetical protein